MKICILASGSFEVNYSSYHLMRDLIDWLLVQGSEVVLIQKCLNTPGYLPDLLQKRKGLYVVDVPFRQAEKVNLIKRILFDFCYYYNTISAIKACQDSDAFFLQSNNTPYLPIWIIRHWTHKPIIYNVQDIFPQNASIIGILPKKSIIYWILHRLQRWALRHSDAIITISEDMKDTLIEAGAESEKISVAYNWENKLYQSRIDEKKQGNEKFHVVYAGNLGRMQNIEIILQAAEYLKTHTEIQFDFYGEGAIKPKCLDYVRQKSLKNVFFYSALPADQAYALYYYADVNVVPLAKGIIKTALPSKMAVCIQCGKPIVFCIDKKSKFAQQIDHIEGYIVVDPEDFKSLADTLLALMETRSKDKGKFKIFNESLKKQFARQESLKIYYQVLQSVDMKKN